MNPTALLVVCAVGCSTNFESAPLHLTKVPTCAKGHRLAQRMVLRVEKGKDSFQGQIDLLQDPAGGTPESMALELPPLGLTCDDGTPAAQ
jgi:hypothetical protein